MPTRWSKPFLLLGRRCDEPPHVYIERDKDEAKFWLEPIRLQSNRGFSRTEINRIQKLVEEHKEQLLVGWNECFNE